MARAPKNALQEEDLKAKIREEFESTDLSIAALARRHGLKSKTTIERWKNREHWARDPDRELARLTRQAQDEAETVSPPPRYKNRKHPGRGKPIEVVAPEEEEARPQTDTSADTDTSPPGRGEGPQARSHLSQRTVSRLTCEDAPPSEMAAASERETLAELHARTTRRQLDDAELLLSVGRALLWTIHDSLVLDDDEKRNVARSRLGGLCPAETYRGLAQGATALMEAGVKIERQAMGMATNHDPVRKQREGQLGGTLVPAAAAEVLEQMPDELLEQMRNLTIGVAAGLRAGQRKAPVIEGTFVAQPPPKES